VPRSLLGRSAESYSISTDFIPHASLCCYSQQSVAESGTRAFGPRPLFSRLLLVRSGGVRPPGNRLPSEHLNLLVTRAL